MEPIDHATYDWQLSPSDQQTMHTYIDLMRKVCIIIDIAYACIFLHEQQQENE